jgi:cytoskeletal protein CcmA (bactofilin family)
MALFGNDKDQPTTMSKQASGTPAANQMNMLGAGSVFEGTLRADSDVRISGRLVGKLDVDGRAIVAPEGSVEGEIKAASADIGGSVNGELFITEKLLLRASARIEGNIKTGRLIVEEGAIFNGECQMGQDGKLRTKADASKTMTMEASSKESTPPRLPEQKKDPRLPAGDRPDASRSRAL